MMRKITTMLAAAALCAAAPVSAQSVLTVDASQKGAAIGPLHYGIFFEEINHAGDGGIYAELIRNRSFEDDLETKSVRPRRRNPNRPGRELHMPRGIQGWHTVGQARAATCQEHLLNQAQEACVELEVKEAGAGIRNEGFWGINAVQGTKYRLSFWVRAEQKWAGTVTASLCETSGTSLGATPISIEAGTEWRRYEAEITATGSNPEASLALTFSKPGSIYLDVVSLFPPTYKDRPNGCRKDLAQLLEALHPRFMRFPGGCYVEGQATENNNLQNRFVWYKTIGPIEQRPGHLSVNWRYNVTDGLGYHEMLQLSEDLGAEPLFVVNVGIGHGWVQPYDQIEEYIQEALDALEYANGPVTSKWGKMRAQNGHPEPFNLRLLEVGNENANFYFDSNRDQSDHYFERYEQFYKAIKAKYPDVQVIGNVESWGTDAPSWRSQLPVDLLDEHYYRSPSWFASYYNKYDTYDRKGPKIYVGEYAVTSNFGVNGHLTAALGEAIYMMGTERNSDVVRMASYAPIFVNENDQAWRPDMIRFNSAKSFGTPSYWVQNLMSNNVGTQNVGFALTDNVLPARIGHRFGLATWGTAAWFSGIKATSLDNGSPIEVQADWTSLGGPNNQEGQWSVTPTAVFQTSQRAEGGIYLNGTTLPDNYALDCTLARTEGAEGAIIVFGYENVNNYLWWNLGGWGNTQHGVEQISSGSKHTIVAKQGRLEPYRPYHARIEVRGIQVRCLLDGELVHEFQLPSMQHIYAQAALNGTDELIVKLVNFTGEAAPLSVRLKDFTPASGTVTVLRSASGTDENTMEQPMKVAPVQSLFPVSSPNFSFTAEPYSLNILRLKR